MPAKHSSEKLPLRFWQSMSHCPEPRVSPAISCTSVPLQQIRRLILGLSESLELSTVDCGPPVFNQPLSFQSTMNSLSFSKTSTPLFSIKSTLFDKNTRVGCTSKNAPLESATSRLLKTDLVATWLPPPSNPLSRALASTATALFSWGLTAYNSPSVLQEGCFAGVA